MSDDSAGADDPGLIAGRCPNAHLTYPRHERCPECAEPQTGSVDLSEWHGEVVTWTESTATPPGVREPNTLALVTFVFENAGERVSVLGGTTDEVSIGDTVEPVYVEELRDPALAVREADSQEWGGFRFRPVE